MKKEQIAAKTAEELRDSFVALEDDFDIDEGILDGISKAAALRALELAEHSAEKRLQEATQHQEKRIAERDALLRKIRDDLLWRSDETDSDGVKIVELSGSLWVKLNELIGRK